MVTLYSVDIVNIPKIEMSTWMLARMYKGVGGDCGDAGDDKSDDEDK